VSRVVTRVVAAAVLCLAASFAVAAPTAKSPVVLKIIETTDVHGAVFPYNFVTDKPADGSLAQLATLLKAERANPAQSVVLLDNGDILQGQPVVYYYNFENTKGPHILSRVMNSLGYDAGTLGNHDIEAGHPVYDKLAAEFHFPWLAANAVRPDGSPYFSPYTVFTRGGVKIAVIGLITPWIPNWLPRQFWTGMRFEDMVVSAQKWVTVVREKVKPDLVIGLFHSGTDFTYGGLTETTPNNENASQLVAAKVSGFDIIFTGHDHAATNKVVKAPDGRDVYIFGAQNAARNVAAVTATLTWNQARGAWDKEITGEVKPLTGIAADDAFLSSFAQQFGEVKSWVSRPIGRMSSRISTRDSMFGDSAFVDLIHNVQLAIAGKPDFGLNAAEISFAAPLSMDAVIPTSSDGTLYVRDMFNLYVYENFLYTMTMTGRQIRDFLEYSYAGWMATMASETDHMISFKKDAAGALVLDEKTKLPVMSTRYYNFDSAAGIRYTVDLTKPVGGRVSIQSMADGTTPFDMARTYSVAINSYRAQGGGGHLVQGARMDDAEVKAMKSVTSATIKDLRFYIMKWIEGQAAALDPRPNGNWEVLPRDWVAKARALDMPLLYAR
jgi:2',3'-cyclic-nucleotide 2'-phosphodiesterase / 3'-nucleotidase